MDGWVRRETLRYAGMGRVPESEVDPRILEFVDRALGELNRVCRPRFTSKIFALHAIGAADSDRPAGAAVSKLPEGEIYRLNFGGVLDVTSRALTVNLKDCEEVVLFAATLGAETDRLISQYSRRDISQGALMEAAATALIEEYCDRCQQELEAQLNQEQKTLRPRFSPGYGDFHIKHQKDMVSLLDLPRQIGVTLTDGGMLAPSKSVTAVMGIAHLEEDAVEGETTGASGQSGRPKAQKHRCHVHGCESCMKTDCIYRRNV